MPRRCRPCLLGSTNWLQTVLKCCVLTKHVGKVAVVDIFTGFSLQLFINPSLTLFFRFPFTVTITCDMQCLKKILPRQQGTPKCGCLFATVLQMLRMYPYCSKHRWRMRGVHCSPMRILLQSLKNGNSCRNAVEGVWLQLILSSLRQVRSGRLQTIPSHN